MRAAAAAAAAGSLPGDVYRRGGRQQLALTGARATTCFARRTKLLVYYDKHLAAHAWLTK